MKRMPKILGISALAMALNFAINTPVAAEQSLAEQAQNPIGSLIIMPFEFDTNFNTGPDNRNQNFMLFKPVVPMSFSPNWTFLARGIFPVLDNPVAGGGRDQGIGDIQLQTFFSPNTPIPLSGGEFTWGAGPIFQFDTASKDTLGTGRNSAGANAVGFWVKKPWTAGLLVSNIWSYDGSGGREDVNLFSAQPIVNYNMSDGWYIKFSPIITANWEADGGNTWTVPLGGGIGKITKFGTQPVNLSLEGYGNVVKPDGGADFTIRAQIAFLFPK